VSSPTFGRLRSIRNFFIPILVFAPSMPLSELLKPE
jgi:hypothetical protein